MMRDSPELLERAIPDVVSTRDLPVPLAAEIDYLAGRTHEWETERPDLPESVRARALALRGETDCAREVLRAMDVSELNTQGLVAAAWAVSRVGPTELVDPLLTRMEEYRDDFLFAGDMPLGPRATVIGLLEATTGRLQPAATALAEAVLVGDARAPLWGALARVEQARVLCCTEAVSTAAPTPRSDLPTAAEHCLISATTFFRAGGYQSLLARIDGLCGPYPDGDGLVAPTLGHLIPGPRWTIGFGVEPQATIRKSKGLTALHHLISNRHRTVPAVELDRVVNGGDARAIADLATAGTLEVLEDGDGHELADALRELLFDEATRSRVSKLLRRTIVKLGDTHKLLGIHLSEAVHTGHACRYQPTSRLEISWRL